MPVDIASGKVELGYDDVSVPGKVKLAWDRYYSTALIDSQPTLLGRGWTSSYGATLTHMSAGFEFITDQGALEFFADPDGSVDRGERLINFGTFLEVFKDSGRYVVQSWDVESGEIWRYCFSPGPTGQPWPL